jgi:hypothetical protein
MMFTLQNRSQQPHRMGAVAKALHRVSPSALSIWEDEEDLAASVDFNLFPVDISTTNTLTTDDDDGDQNDYNPSSPMAKYMHVEDYLWKADLKVMSSPISPLDLECHVDFDLKELLLEQDDLKVQDMDVQVSSSSNSFHWPASEKWCESPVFIQSACNDPIMEIANLSLGSSDGSNEYCMGEVNESLSVHSYHTHQTSGTSTPNVIYYYYYSSSYFTNDDGDNYSEISIESDWDEEASIEADEIACDDNQNDDQMMTTQDTAECEGLNDTDVVMYQEEIPEILVIEVLDSSESFAVFVLPKLGQQLDGQTMLDFLEAYLIETSHFDPSDVVYELRIQSNGEVVRSRHHQYIVMLIRFYMGQCSTYHSGSNDWESVSTFKDIDATQSCTSETTEQSEFPLSASRSDF